MVFDVFKRVNKFFKKIKKKKIKFLEEWGRSLNLKSMFGQGMKMLSIENEDDDVVLIIEVDNGFFILYGNNTFFMRYWDF